MKTTPELRKERRKHRRAESRRKALAALINMTSNLGLDDPFMDQDIPTEYTPSITTSTTAALAALMRLGRRVRPLVELAQKELDRRYSNEHDRRRDNLKKIFRQIARENAHQPELIREKVLAAMKEMIR